MFDFVRILYYYNYYRQWKFAICAILKNNPKTHLLFIQVKIQNIDVLGVSCLLYYEIGHGAKPVLVSTIPSNTFVDIEILPESLTFGETLITCKYLSFSLFDIF